jgi:hypothetical protein
LLALKIDIGDLDPGFSPAAKLFAVLPRRSSAHPDAYPGLRAYQGVDDPVPQITGGTYDKDGLDVRHGLLLKNEAHSRSARKLGLV